MSRVCASPLPQRVCSACAEGVSCLQSVPRPSALHTFVPAAAVRALGHRYAALHQDTTKSTRPHMATPGLRAFQQSPAGPRPGADRGPARCTRRAEISKTVPRGPCGDAYARDPWDSVS